MNKYILNCQSASNKTFQSLSKETIERLSELLSDELDNILHGQDDFTWSELENLIQKEGKRILTNAHARCLEKLDDRLCAEKSNTWVVAKKMRVKKTSLLGDLSFTKRIYKHREMGITCCFLDRKLHAPRRMRATPAFAEIAARIACDLSFQKTADMLEAFSQSTVSKAAIKDFVARTEALLEKNDLSQVESFFVLGEKPHGKISAPVLYIEADATYISSQEPNKKDIRVHTVSFYTGKIKKGEKIVRENVLRVAGTGNVEAFRAKAVAEALSIFNLSTIQRIRVGSDGEKCYQRWNEYFPSRIEFENILDPYHLFKIVEGCFDRNNPEEQKAKQDVYALLKDGYPQAASDYLETLVKRGLAHYKDEMDVAQYIRNNAFAIRKVDYSLGTVEADQQHIVSARMKSVPCGWSQTGAHAVLRLRTRIASGLPLIEASWEDSYTEKEVRAIRKKLKNTTRALGINR